MRTTRGDKGLKILTTLAHRKGLINGTALFIITVVLFIMDLHHYPHPHPSPSSSSTTCVWILLQVFWILLQVSEGQKLRWMRENGVRLGRISCPCYCSAWFLLLGWFPGLVVLPANSDIPSLASPDVLGCCVTLECYETCVSFSVLTWKLGITIVHSSCNEDFLKSAWWWNLA